MPATTERVCLLSLILLAVGMRLAGIDALLPMARDPDSFIVDQARDMRRDRDRAVEQREPPTKYPEFVARVLSLLPDAPASRWVASDGHSVQGKLEDHLARASAPYLHARILVALLSVLALPATFFLCRRFLGSGPALLATALVATSLLHFYGSRQARPHAVVASFIVLALLAIFRMRQDGRWRSHLLAGAATGIAVGTLQTGLFLLPALLLAHAQRGQALRASHRWRILAALALVLACFLLFDPSALSFNQEGGAEKFSVGGLHFRLSEWTGGGFSKMPGQLWSFDPVLAGLFMVGLAAVFVTGRARWGRERCRDALVVLAFVVPYWISIGLYNRTEARYLSALLPMIAGVAAVGGWLLVAGVARITRSPRISTALVVTCLLALPAYATGRMALLCSRIDTLTQAAQWIEDNVDEESLILLHPELSVPLLSTKRALAYEWRRGSPLFSPWLVYQATVRLWNLGPPTFDINPLIKPGRFGPASIPRNKRDVRAILSTYGSGILVLKTDNPRSPIVLGGRQSGTVLARFPNLVESARGPEGNLFRPNINNMLKRVLLGASWGPSIEILRFDPASISIRRPSEPEREVR